MVCPKCKAHIPTFDLKPNCKHCGVNIMLYTQEKDLARDAKRAELEFANARIIVAKIKAAFIKGALPIIRLVFILLLAGALVLPVSSATFSFPLFNQEISLSALGIYQLFDNGALSLIPDFATSTLFAAATKQMLLIAGIYLIALVLSVVLLVVELLSFISIKKTAKAMTVISAIGAAVSAVLSIMVFTLKAEQSFITFNKGFGAFAVLLCFIVCFFCNYKIFKSEIKLDLRENDLERREILKKVRSGEINLDDLSLPVFESEKEKEERLKALEEALKKEEEGKE